MFHAQSCTLLLNKTEALLQRISAHQGMWRSFQASHSKTFAKVVLVPQKIFPKCPHSLLKEDLALSTLLLYPGLSLSCFGDDILFDELVLSFFCKVEFLSIDSSKCLFSFQVDDIDNT